ncbi:MAG: metallophosphoesterase [Clostridiales bacterium]|nr:metallophosphoesterase [Clostridiales bacterium]
MPFVIALLVLVICFVIYEIFENKNLVVTNYQIQQDTVPKAFHDMRFICLTDLHLNRYGKNNEKLIQKIHECNPDAILIAGDMVTIHQTHRCQIVIDLLEKLAEKYVIYYASGNHELRWANKASFEDNSFIEYKEKLESLGVIYLDNADITVKHGEDLLQIVGLNLSIDYYNKGGKPKPLSQKVLTECIHQKNSAAYTILLAHVPDYFEQYVDWGADFILSGHNHGGIMRLWKLGGVISPRYEIFPKYDAGVFKKGHSVMLLSRGLGTHTIPIRIFNRPELICVQIKQKQTRR